jgi:acyl-CoA reductase-like NAD-dependent aldehyde dehydrogenase
LKVKNSVIGDPEKKGIEIGPVVDKAQYERIMNIISTATTSREGTLLHGGNAIGDKVHINHVPYN